MISAPSSVSGGPIGRRPRFGARERAALALFVLAALREHIVIAIRADAMEADSQSGAILSINEIGTAPR
jgi:hypothetical protein